MSPEKIEELRRKVVEFLNDASYAKLYFVALANQLIETGPDPFEAEFTHPLVIDAKREREAANMKIDDIDTDYTGAVWTI